MTIVICPGFHPPELTIEFLKGLGRVSGETSLFEDIIYPAHRLPPYSSHHLLTFLREQIAADKLRKQITANKSGKKYQERQPLLLIGFSAGVVAAIGAAQAWQAEGGSVKAVIAIDGWGVPLWGSLPVHRMSHDAFTHWSSILLGGGGDAFYADPSVGHLDLWRSPQQVWGYYVKPSNFLFSPPQTSDRDGRTTAAMLLNSWLHHYGEGTIA